MIEKRKQAAFQISKSLVLGLLRFGIAYVLFFYLAHFTEVQSIVLAIVGLCAIDGYRLALKVAEQQPLKFEPFWVEIRLNWYAICEDFSLADVEKWKELLEKSKPAESTYSVVRNGMTFTMLSPTLFYSDDHHRFFGELDCHTPIEELKAAADEYFVPQFWIKRTIYPSVIEFGLVTQNPLKSIPNTTDSQGNIAIARLPEDVFYGYFHVGDYDLDRARTIQERTKAQLAEFGWTEKQRDAEDSLWKWPYEINHKYIRVRYRGLS
jgi:hypothetical protein